MYKCICGKEYETIGALNGHKAKCKIYQEKLQKLIDKHLTKEFLEWWFYERKGSSFILAKLFDDKYNQEGFKLNVPKIINRCQQFGIKTWTIKEGNNLPHVRKKRHEHNNLAKGSPGYIKRQEKLAKEGITNVFQRESVKQKIKHTMMEKYGVTNPAYLEWNIPNNGQESKPHLKVIEYLESRGLIKNIDIFSEKNHIFEHFNDELNKTFCPRPDIWIPSINTVIEIYGDRWHANPDKYKSTDIIHTWYGDITAEQIWDRDRIRTSHMENYFNTNVIILWEDEINKNNYKSHLDYFLHGIYKN